MKSEKAFLKNSTSFGIVSSVFIFVVFLLTIPYHLAKLSDQNSLLLESTYYIDKTSEADFNDVLGFQKGAWINTESFKFGLSNKPHWLRFTIPQKKSDGEHVLLLSYGLLDKVDIWFVNKPDANTGVNTDANTDVIAAYKTGDSLPFAQRVTKTEHFVFTLPKSTQDVTVYLRVASKGPLNVPLELWSHEQYIEYANLQNLFLGLFFGFMIAMALSNLFVFSTTRKSIFLLYAAYVTSFAMVIASLHGVGFKYIWPNNTWLQENAIVIFASFTLICILSLTINLLKLKTQAPRIYRLLHKVRYVFIALLCAAFVAPYELTIKAVLVLLIVTSPLILGAGVSLAIKGSTVARYFCGAWAVLLSSGVVIALDNFGLYEPIIQSSYLLMVGAVTESVLLALALSINFSQQLVEAKLARDAAVESEKAAVKAKEELIALQEENQSNLEYSIEERTLELEIAMRELGEKNRELEKLSSLDPLTGLLNRRFFDKRILAEARRSKRERTMLSVAMLDIDHFKQINDNYGHMCGDHCLKVFASILNDTLKRPSDVICRYGGEEFVLILPNTPQEGLERVLEKIRLATQDKKIMFEGQEVQMTVSIGGCARTIASDDEHELIIAYADKLLYQAKESGRNKVVVDTY